MRFLLIALSVLIPLSASAEPENMTLKYEGYYGSMKAGELKVRLNENADGSYKYYASVVTQGLVKYITKYSSDTKVEGKITDNKFFPSLYDTTFQPKKKPKQNIVITYKNGAAQEVATPAENRGKRPEVESKDKDNKLDPISAIMFARERIKEIVEAGTPLPYDFEQPVFDGRRVFLGKGQIVGYKEKKIDGKVQKLLHLHGQRVPVAGFRKGEIEDMKTGEPVFDIYLDSNYIPVLVEGSSRLGEGKVVLANKCLGVDCGV